MCWSGEASAVLASVGLATTAYAAYKKEPTELWVCLGYFSLMELLQAYTYTVINDCAHPGNQIATLFGYLHIAFQPFFINAMSMHFVPKNVARKAAPWAYAFCFFSVIFMILQVYPFDWAGVCDPSRPLCGSRLCSVSGNWHIAWEVPTNGLCNWSTHSIFSGFPTYVIAAFFIPMLYGAWRITLYHLLLGPGLSHVLTNNYNEIPAVWCLLSIGILLLVVKTPIRKFMYVRNYGFIEKLMGSLKRGKQFNERT